ncbi:MAG TPA: hypothetical protein VHL57_12695, partial [Flavobacteriales bacterium]|jgi:ATP-dependent Lhr-like helicase|nr:hypothetical protein [Flavobacteriales bacterium]
MRFLFNWHGIGTGDRPEGPEALRGVIEKLQGAEAPAVAWESEILPARLADYAPEWMDQLCFSGRIAWGKLTPYAGEANAPASLRNSPISICLREDLPYLLEPAVAPVPSPGSGPGLRVDPTEAAPTLSNEAEKVLAQLHQRGALFYHDLTKYCNLLASQVEQGLAELVAKGRVSADGFTGLRALLVPTSKRTAMKERRSRRGSNMPFSLEQAGRWWLFDATENTPSAQTGSKGSTAAIARTEELARILLLRYGVIFRKLVQRERCAPPWRDLLKVLRRMEDRGELRGGRFVSGVYGEQFALPNAIPLLRAQQKPPEPSGTSDEGDAGYVVLNAADPLNLTGVITPGDRLAARYNDRILFRQGVPIAVHDGEDLRWLEKPRQDMDAHQERELVTQRLRRQMPERLRAFYGKGIG